MLKKIISSLAVAGLITLVNTAEALAAFRFTNSTGKTVWVSFQWYENQDSDGSDWETAGWWKLEPGETKTVFGADLQSVNKNYYYYAETADGNVWAGPYSTCVPSTAFQWPLNVCNNAPGTRYVGFRHQYIGNYNNYTLNLVP